MQYRDAIASSLNMLRMNRMRSLLTMLGIVIGIASTILLMSLGASVQRYVLDQIKGVGSDLVFIVPGAPTGAGASSSAFGIIVKTLVKRDIESLLREPSINTAVPVVRGQGRMIAGNTDKTVTWQASSEEFFTVNNLPIETGMAFTAADVRSYNRVVVLGSELASELFGNRNPVGASVRLKDISFRVVGVLKPKGVGALGINQDLTAVIPLTVGQKQLLGIDYYHFVAVQANPDYAAPFVKARVTSILRQNHSITDPDKDDFVVRTQEDVLSVLGNITTILTVFLTAIAAISLIVGGVGIMNIMFVSVIERTREIGLRKAVGATEGDILRQFLVEAVLMTSAGGVIGIVVGTLLTAAAYFAVRTFAGIEWAFLLPPLGIALAVVVSVVTGLVFGVFPARSAARMNPIDALRHE